MSGWLANALIAGRGGLTIRPIRGPKQRAKLRELQLLCLPADKPAEVEKGGCAFAAYDGTTMVAFAMARPSQGYQKTIYLCRAGVHPDYRGRGLQRELIRLREAWAKSRGFKHVITDTTNDNAPSMRSLIAEGYRPYWPQMFKPWAFKHSVYWRKEI